MPTMISQGNGVPAMTAEHHANNSVKTGFVEALFANDWEAMAKFLHPDFELREPDALAYGGIYKGLSGFKKCWELIPQTGHKTEYLNTLRCFFTEDPNSIIVELEHRGTNTKTGKTFSGKILEQFDFRDGKILAISLFWFNI